MFLKHQVINHIIGKYNFTNYLEIGVRYVEDCFNHISCSTKHSVDPGYENPNNPATYKFTSDSFFTQLEHNYLDILPNYKWDVILIDGLHLSYQVEKDILNSLNHLYLRRLILSLNQHLSRHKLLPHKSWPAQ